MTLVHRRLSHAALEDSVSDPSDRQIMHMSTLIGIDAEPPNKMWLLETSWDGASIGDVQVFRNTNCGPSGEAMRDPAGKDLAPNWVWWGGVPRGKVKSYRFSKSEHPTPQTLDTASPFNAERKEESRQANKGSPARA